VILLQILERERDCYLFVFACVCSSSISPCMISNNLQNSSSIDCYRRRRYNRHDSSENRHAANGTGTDRAESITSATSASKRQKKTNNILNNNHILTHTDKHYHSNRSTSTPNRIVSSSVFLFLLSSLRSFKYIHAWACHTYIIEYMLV
jgi:hypothetical protein